MPGFPKLQKLVGPTLLSSCGKVWSTSQLFNKKDQEGEVTVVVGLLFTTTTTGKEDQQDKEFLSILSELYKGVNRNNKKCFEIIHIPLEDGNGEKGSVLSSSLSSFFTIAQGEEAGGRRGILIQEYLVRKFRVQNKTNSCSLILMDGETGSIINFQGKENVLRDGGGVGFPWGYQKCSDILRSAHLITANNPSQPHPQQIVDKGKRIIKGIYFAAYWCPPCRTFSQLLQQTYRKIKKKHDEFEIIFVSSDRSQTSFDRCFSPHPWLAIPLEDSKRREELMEMYNVKNIPTLVILDEEDNVITYDGREEVMDDCDGVDFPWYPKPVEELRDKHSDLLNTHLCILYFTTTSGNEEFDYDRTEETLALVATKYSEDMEVEEAFQPKFFMATDSEISESLRIFMDLDESHPYLVAVHRGRYAVINGDRRGMKVPRISEFINRFQSHHQDLEYKYLPTKKVI